MKTSELIGKPLDWAVAKCKDEAPTWDEVSEDWFMGMNSPHCFLKEFSPSTNWAQGGPIIDLMRPILTPQSSWTGAALPIVTASLGGYPGPLKSGPSYLIAAMRCYVASKLGDEVDVPKELL